MCSCTTTVCTSPGTERYLSQRCCVTGGRLWRPPRPPRGESSFVDGGLEYLCCSIAACTRSDSSGPFSPLPSPIVCKPSLLCTSPPSPTAVLVRYNAFVLHTRKTRRGRQTNTTVPTTPNEQCPKTRIMSGCSGPPGLWPSPSSPAQYNLLWWSRPCRPFPLPDRGGCRGVCLYMEMCVALSKCWWCGLKARRPVPPAVVARAWQRRQGPARGRRG